MSNFLYCIIRGNNLDQVSDTLKINTKLKVISRSLEVVSMSFKFFKCFVSLHPIWWLNFINILSCTPEIQGHFSI